MKLSTSVLSSLLLCTVCTNALPLLDNLFELEQQLLAPQPGDSSYALELVDSETLQDTITTHRLEKKAKVLYNLAKASKKEFGHPTRVIASPGHWATVNYLLTELEKLSPYYEVSTQDFHAIQGKVHDFSLLVDGAKSKSAQLLSLTPPTDGAVTAPLVVIDEQGCDLANYPANVTGAVALIQRGSCSFGLKSKLAFKAGAAAAVIYNNEPGSLLGTLEPPIEGSVPSLSISKDEGEGYVKLLTEGHYLPATVYIDSEVKNIKTTNVIAQSTQGDQENVVLLGAHSDSVAKGPGLNDDGSGSLSLLEVAQQLTKFKLNNAVRFAWWSLEEEGLLGSDYYVSVLSEEEKSKIRLFMDYDMMASPNYALQVYDANNIDNPKGSEELKTLYIDWYVSHGLNYTLIPFDGRSDYVAFIDAGIPGGGIATGAEGIKTEKEVELFGGVSGEQFDQCYHELCDDLTNLNYDAWLINTKLILHSVATYARSFDGFPARESSVATTKALGVPTHKYHGSKLVI